VRLRDHPDRLLPKARLVGVNRCRDLLSIRRIFRQRRDHPFGFLANDARSLSLTGHPPWMLRPKSNSTRRIGFSGAGNLARRRHRSMRAG
jgi:hypothetical protein